MLGVVVVPNQDSEFIPINGGASETAIIVNATCGDVVE
jgi:hypothetical protein